MILLRLNTVRFLTRCYPLCSRPCFRIPIRGYSNEKPHREYGLMHIEEQFKNIPRENRTKATFLEAIELFKKRSRNERGHVEFINSALWALKDFKLNKDLDAYKALIGVLPVGPFLPKNVFQRQFAHFGHQQRCAVRVLDELEWNKIYPDKELHDMVAAVFGPWAWATRKSKRQMYWLPKLRYSNKYLDPRDVENMNLTFAQKAKLVLQMICRDKGNQITFHQNSEDLMIVSGQSPLQRSLIRKMDIENMCFYVDGPFRVYLQEHAMEYISFTCDPIGDAKRYDDRFIEHAELEDLASQRLYDGPYGYQKSDDDYVSIHEQTDQCILALAVMQQNSPNLASEWVGHLQEKNPILQKATVIIRISEALE